MKFYMSDEKISQKRGSVFCAFLCDEISLRRKNKHCAILVASFVLPAVSALTGRILGNNRHEDEDDLQK